MFVKLFTTILAISSNAYDTVSAHENWQLCNIRQLDWIPAQIPGDIYAALLKTGKMPDPYFGDNEYQAKALMEEDYEYRTVFNYEEAQFKDCQEAVSYTHLYIVMYP